MKIWKLLAATAALSCALTGCPKKTADLELEAARAAIDQARSKKANDCAKETYQAAEAAIAEARRLAEEGEVQAAKDKAAEAQTLAEQAAAASKPGCDEPKKIVEDATPSIDPSASSDASKNMRLDEALETVYFDYNDASIREDSKTSLTKVAGILRAQSVQRIEIEGHCDVRGSTEYNLHLGERRARAVVKYLVTQGVKPDQLSIISYGEERPVDLGMTDASHQRNRRAELKKL